MKFYGRDQEIAALTNELRLAETSSRLAVITGRRRVGKTKLILKVAEESGRPMLYFLCRRRYAEAELAQIWLDEVRETFGLSLKVVERPHETLVGASLLPKSP